MKTEYSEINKKGAVHKCTALYDCIMEFYYYFHNLPYA